MYLILVASLNENLKLANRILEKLEKNNKEAELINLVKLNLPMYDSDKELNEGIPDVAKKLGEKMQKAQGFIIVSPEYNYSIPPVLSNAIAWTSRISEDFRQYFSEKMVLLATHSGVNGYDVISSLRTQFSRLGAFVMPREIITTYTKEIKEESLDKILAQFIKFAQ
jgi:chromate reductase, NAD(P)H dehydrogenase (quinone)